MPADQHEDHPEVAEQGDGRDNNAPPEASAGEGRHSHGHKATPRRSRGAPSRAEDGHRRLGDASLVGKAAEQAREERLIDLCSIRGWIGPSLREDAIRPSRPPVKPASSRRLCGKDLPQPGNTLVADPHRHDRRGVGIHGPPLRLEEHRDLLP